MFEAYFRIFPWHELPKGATGFDAGCGSGRWAVKVAPRVGKLHLVDASSEALSVARHNLTGHANVEFIQSTVDDMPFAPGSMDFGYSLGVLHHIPDTQAALNACVSKLRPGAPFLLYLYYAFDDRPKWFKALWRSSDLTRRAISRLPHTAKLAVTTPIAALLYWPLARGARLAEKLGHLPKHWPLQYYRGRSFYTMRTDALDRFGTRLEQRFTRPEMEQMMREAGLESIEFGEHEPYWVAVGRRAKNNAA